MLVMSVTGGKKMKSLFLGVVIALMLVSQVAASSEERIEDFSYPIEIQETVELAFTEIFLGEGESYIYFTDDFSPRLGIEVENIEILYLVDHSENDGSDMMDKRNSKAQVEILLWKEYPVKNEGRASEGTSGEYIPLEEGEEISWNGFNIRFEGLGKDSIKIGNIGQSQPEIKAVFHIWEDEGSIAMPICVEGCEEGIEEQLERQNQLLEEIIELLEKILRKL